MASPNLIEQATRRLAQLQRSGVKPSGLLIGGIRHPAVASDQTTAAPRTTSVGDEPAVRASVPSVTIDLRAISAAGFVTPDAPRSALQEQYRAIKRRLIQNAVGQGAATPVRGNLVMVTSALPGEGKTYTSINLAMSIAAERDCTVMLVDADVANPSIFRTLRISGEVPTPNGTPSPGLLDVLEGKAALSEAVLRTNVEKLTLLPAGGYHPHATELLASDGMRLLLEDMATRYPDRIVVFDSPPLLPTTEAAALAAHMGQIVIVVQADKTLRKEVESALAAIDSCPLRWLLLNQARGASGAAYGGYGYGYGSAARRHEYGAQTDSARESVQKESS